jgi:hypothetical protein
MDKQEAIARIAAAATAGNILYTEHAQQRMVERGISRLMVSSCLKNGRSSRPCYYNDEYGTYECRLEHYMAGMTFEVVASISESDPHTIIITVIDTTKDD